MIRTILAAALVLLAAVPLRGDVGILPVSSDYDAEFARAADLLEAGHREEGEKVLRELRRRAARRAWDARIGFLLALDDERRRDFRRAAERLAATPAASIGLEPFRLALRARNLAAAGLSGEALSELEALGRREEPFAGRARAGRFAAGLLVRGGSPASAAAALARVAAEFPSERVAVAPERLRFALATGDRITVTTAAREILLGAALADRAPSTPAAIRAALRREEARLSPADRSRRGRALVAAGDAARGVALLERERPGRLPAAERELTLLALARGQFRLERTRAALRTLTAIPVDASTTSFEARLLLADVLIARLPGSVGDELRLSDPRVASCHDALLALTGPGAPPAVRFGAGERLVRLLSRARDFSGGLEQARLLAAESPGTRAGFEPLWLLGWLRYLAGDAAGARDRFEVLSSVYARSEVRRRLSYWIGRCLEREGRKADAAVFFRSLAAAGPPDLYALFSRRRTPAARTARPTPLADPSVATATFRRADELLRLRLFEDAADEIRSLPASRGRDLRLAEAEFALGHFLAATSAAKRAFPELGTVEESRVPDAWRRLYYPAETGGFIPARAREFGLDSSLLRALVRQESVFDARAVSRAGALGLTQLLPSTARSVARSVLRVRYRQAFLYDPGMNAELGAAYLRRLYDRFGQNPIYALAAYNGGPTRMARLLREHPRLEEDEVFESHPAAESREYVRRVLLFAETYRELYPG